MANAVTTKPGMPVTISALHKAYAGKAILQDLNFTIPGGQFVALVGHSGCGKSTLLRLLANLTQPTQGTILADSKPLPIARQDIRLMFQDARLLPWRRVIQNVGLGLTKNQQVLAEAALAAVGLQDRKNDWPATLSGGQKQRVALARALVHQPRLLLLDEPLGALDALTRIEMQQRIEQLWLKSGFTTLLVTHDVNEAIMLADRVILIEQGAIGLDITIDMPRPRQRGEPMLVELEKVILNRIFTPASTAIAGG